ncbi:MAG: hypothetical protein OSB21_05645 [Myxococcota bacterium]|nr:hypothetical protein [Myxococcota bacterium]
MTRRLYLVFTVACMVLSACPEPTAPSLPRADAGVVGDAGTLQDSGSQACAQNSDCPDDQTCVGGACELPFTGCQTDRDCSEGAICFDGVCLRTCGNGGDVCPDGLTCVESPEGGLCVISCETDRDCPERTECQRVDRNTQICAPMEGGGVTCGLNGACPEGQQCNLETNICEEDGTPQPEDCAGDRDCGDGERCLEGMCQEVDGRCRNDRDCGDNAECIENWCVSGDPDPEPAECNRDEDCENGMICHPEFLRCIDNPADGCQSNNECQDGFACVRNLCRPEEAQPCGDGFPACEPDWLVCDEAIGACMPQSCAGDQTCPDGMVCEEGIWCLPAEGPGPGGCGNDADCPGDQVCRRDRCFDPSIGEACNDNNDCGEGLACRDGRCIPADAPGGDRCREASDCDQGQLCRRGQCEDGGGDGERCRNNDQCGNGFACVNNRCTAENGGGGCVNNDQCADGQICQDGNCIEDNQAACTNNTDCADGQLCVERQCLQQCGDDRPCPEGQQCRGIGLGRSVCVEP